MAIANMATALKAVFRGLGLAGALALLTACGRQSGEAGPDAGVVSAMNQGVSLMGQYLYEDAVRVFEEVVKAAPESMEARVNLAIARFNRNRQEDLAVGEQLLEEVLRKDPGHQRALYFRAVVLQHLGKADQAIPLLERVVQARPEDGAAWYLLALCKQRTGQPAETEFLKAVQFKPYLYSAYYQLYQAAMRAGQDGPAQQYLERFKSLRESPLGESLEFPQYNQMGDLALALPVAPVPLPPISKSQFRFGDPRVVATSTPAVQTPASGGGVAAGDLDGDGRIDLVHVPSAPGRLGRLCQLESGAFQDLTAGSGLEAVTNVVACAIGDFDNDEQPDLGLTTSTGLRLLRSANGQYMDVSAAAGLTPAPLRSAVFLDADHDGDLDVFACGPAANQLWNNNGDGTFTNIAARAGVECVDGNSARVMAADVDSDRDLDLVVLREGGAARVFLNELLGRYQEVALPGVDIRGEAGAVLQDMNGDGVADIVALGGSPRRLQLWVGDGHGGFKASEGLAGVSQTLDSWGPQAGFRAADVDLDGDLDLVCAANGVRVLLNNGQGRFVVQAASWAPSNQRTLAGFEVFDVTGDLVPDLVVVERDRNEHVTLCTGSLTPPSTAVAVMPSGVRSRDGRTRSPASGYGVRLTTRAGLREQRLLFTGLAGGVNQSCLPVVMGLGGAAKADFVQLGWPDGVMQVETALAAGQTHKIAELQRKISSCPVLFAWNGTRFEFITDFAGVGGLGYFSQPGVTAPPQVLEHVKIEPGQLRARDGFYELRVTEPMEEAAYVDRLELLAVDHPAGVVVFPDERLAISGPPPTHRLLVAAERVFAGQARDPAGRECADALTRVDRRYAYEPRLDRRYIGFCPPHMLELDFGERLAGRPAGERLFLFINGFIEYPYSQTVYAASQSRVGWEPIRIEAGGADGGWQTVVADAGVPGGMGRMMTVDLTGTLPAGTRRLRLTTNLEVYYDQVFLAADAGAGTVVVRSVPLKGAELRYVGFAREYSPDGRLPLIFDYELTDATAPFHVLTGDYTRYGAVEPLLADFDDRYVIMGPGDEIALRFDATALPEPAPGWERSFVLVSHAYCKDMDLYTATPQTLAPLPFRTMSRYPYPAGERPPNTEAHRLYRQTYNTRRVE